MNSEGACISGKIRIEYMGISMEANYYVYS